MDINTFRKKKKMTHEELAAMFGVALRTSYHWAQKGYFIERKDDCWLVFRKTLLASTEISRAKIKREK